MKTRSVAKRLLLAGLVLFAGHSCEQGVEPAVIHENGAVVFTASVDGENHTRASDAFWDTDDEIGVFMKIAGQSLSFSSILSNVTGNHYITKDKITFEAFEASEAIYYPSDGSAVDFIAYYPHQSGPLSFIYKVDVGDQTSQEAIDLLYSDNMKNNTKASHSSNLMFSHQLARIRITIKAGQGITTLEGLEVDISGVSTTADFNLANGNLVATDAPDKTVAFKITEETAGEKTAEAILIPDNGEAERIIHFKLPSGKTFKHKIAIGTELEKSTRYTFTAVLEDENAGAEPSYIETPLLANLPATQQYVLHMMPDGSGNRNFAMLYDTKYRLALWVAYPLIVSYHTGNSGRTKEWAYDPKIAEDFQPDLSSGFPANNTDRGQHIPSGDRTCTIAANHQTFYYSNLTARQTQMNQGIWASLEGKVRTWASNCDTMYVVTGAMIQTATDQQIEYVYCNSNRLVARPKCYFKALAQRTGDNYTTLAFLINNEAPATGDSYNNHRLTVKELEEKTGYTFFPSLSDAIKNTIEANKWN